MPELSLQGPLLIANLLKDAGLVDTTSEALRMIKQGAVRIDGEAINDGRLEVSSGSCQVYQVGKRKFARVTLS
jgi:tyrosyl-tRNA synthetase